MRDSGTYLKQVGMRSEGSHDVDFTLKGTQIVMAQLQLLHLFDGNRGISPSPDIYNSKKT